MKKEVNKEIRKLNKVRTTALSRTTVTQHDRYSMEKKENVLQFLSRIGIGADGGRSSASAADAIDDAVGDVHGVERVGNIPFVDADRIGRVFAALVVTHPLLPSSYSSSLWQESVAWRS